jgi:hypothetical protein
MLADADTVGVRLTLDEDYDQSIANWQSKPALSQQIRVDLLAAVHAAARVACASVSQAHIRVVELERGSVIAKVNLTKSEGLSADELADLIIQQVRDRLYYTYIDDAASSQQYVYISMHMSVCICMYAVIYIHACIHTYIHTYIHAYMHAYIHTHIHTYIDSTASSRQAPSHHKVGESEQVHRRRQVWGLRTRVLVCPRKRVRAGPTLPLRA